MRNRALFIAAALVMCTAARANIVTFSGDTTGSPAFNRPVEDLSALSLIGTGVRYGAYQLSVSVTGTYTFEIAAQYDSFALLYSPSFNPIAPITNALLANDDLFAAVPTTSGFAANLAAGATYTFVNAGFEADDFGAFVSTIGGPGVISVNATLSPLPTGLFVHTGTTAGGPTFARPLEDLSALSLVGTNVAYERFDFTVATSGDYSFLTTGSFDTFSLLYANGFNPAMSIVNAQVANDDLFPASFTALSASGLARGLVAGVNYSLITTGFEANQFGDFTVMVTGPGAIQTGVVAAVPEPDLPLLLIAGSAVMGWLARRRRT